MIAGFLALWHGVGSGGHLLIAVVMLVLMRCLAKICDGLSGYMSNRPGPKAGTKS